MKIPFSRLKQQYSRLKADFDHALMETFDESQFVRGRAVKEFELQFARKLAISHCINTNSGTDALYLALRGLKIGPGDEVITPAWSWISSVETISMTGATPVFADVNPDTYTLCVEDVQKKLTEKSKAIICVHLYGQAAAVTSLRGFADAHNLSLIEDCAQAHFSKDGTDFVGTIGHAAAFSFYPTKNLGAFGDAGSIVTHDDELAEKFRRLANHGALHKNDHLIEGMNSRMDTLQAAVLNVKLRFIDDWNQRRIELAGLYTDLLKEEEQIVTPVVRPGSTHTFHAFAIRAGRRDELKEYLSRNGVETLIHYPLALPNVPAYKNLRLNADRFPVANDLQNKILSLPIDPELSEREVSYVVEKIKAFYRK